MNSSLALVTVLALAQSTTPAPEKEPVHWAIQLGLRVAAVDQHFPTVDRVVLVPDAATCLDKISKWTTKGRWPVLIEDDVLAPMFIRRFKPAQVVRRTPVGPTPSKDDLRLAIEHTVAKVWEFHGSPEDAFKHAGFVPPGLILTSTADPAWIAAAALAAGHGQIIRWIDDDFGKPDSILPPTTFDALSTRVNESLASAGLSFKTLGDDLDTVTICRRVAGRVAPLGIEPPMQSQTIDGQNPIAMTDALCRREDGGRSCVVGWIFGSETRCNYVAMCSLFLPRESVSFFNGYVIDGGWEQYDVAVPAETMKQKGYQSHSRRVQQAGRNGWLSFSSGGVAVDMLCVNSSGNADFFDLNKDRMSYLDIPILNHPAAIHFIHSWSMQLPENPATVGARWLDNGAYAYVGSVHEPLLSAFVPPVGLVDRWTNLVPFLVAARHWEGPFSRAWRVNTFGDPLMLAAPPSVVQHPRVAPPETEGNLHKEVAAAIRATKDDATGEHFEKAIALLNILGQDEIAISLWQNALAAGNPKVADRAARPSLGPLFRSQNMDAFLSAFSRILAPSQRDRTMLWQLLSPRLATITDRSTLLLLESNLRSPGIEVDVAQLLPHLRRTLGETHATAFRAQLISAATDPEVARKLKAIK